VSSGFKNMVINTQERAVSSDINRLQKFQGKDFAEFFRYMLDVYSQEDLEANAIGTVPSTMETPIRAEIINGGLVRPGVASLAISVDAMVAMFLAPDAAADESPYKYIADTGSTGTLLMTANASGSTRIDVIECSIDPAQQIVTDNRDIFDPVTGLFTASAVTKETKSVLRYRVRAGTPGAGYPGGALGWLPLAVASVPTATTTNDTITFWDVRPLVSDRIYQPFAITRDLPTPGKRFLVCDSLTASPQADVTGRMVGYDIGGRRVGGTIRRGTPGSDATAAVRITDTANQTPGFAPGVNSIVYLYLVCPFGLPRWARYNDAPSARVPRSPKGIPVVSSTSTNGLTGRAAAPIGLPTSTGLLGSAVEAETLCILTTMAGAGSAIRSSICDGEETILGASDGGPPVHSPIVVAGTAYDGTSAKFTLLPGFHYPKHARRVKVSATFKWTNASGVTQSYAPAGTSVTEGDAAWNVSVAPKGTAWVYNTAHLTRQAVADAGSKITAIANGSTGLITVTCWIPVEQDEAGTTHEIGFEASIAATPGGAGNINAAVSNLQVQGWEF